jgi:UDPglucose 6-dehydrogenase
LDPLPHFSEGERIIATMNSDIDVRTVSIIGLGRLGAPMAGCFASRGFNVIGVDRDERKVEVVARGESPVSETGVAALIRDFKDRIETTSDTEDAVRRSEATFVVVATPTDAETGLFSLQFLQPACEAIGRGLASKRGVQLVVICSTVTPGAIVETIIPTLESASGKKLGESFHLCYWPELIALGSFVSDFLNPEVAIIGSDDEKSAQRLASIFERLFVKQPPVHKTTFRNAEIAKLALNAYVATKIGFANFLGRLCEKLPGADVDTVTQILGEDTRIGAKFLRGGLPFGGACFPRDIVSMSAVARKAGVDASIVEGVGRSNAQHLEELVELVRANAHGEPVAVLGIAFKPGIDVVEGSPSHALALRLAREGIDVIAWDPSAVSQDLAITNALDEVRRAPVVFVASRSADMSALGDVLDGGAVRVVIDAWRVVDESRLPKGVRYIALGRG